MLRILFFLTFILTSVHSSSQNIFTSRKYWTQNPSIEEIKSSVNEENNLVAFDKHKFDAVTWAILEDVSIGTIKYLINIDGNGVNKRSHDGRTPIFWAAYKNNVELIRYLIENNARTDLIDDHGYGLATFAAVTGQLNEEIYDICKENGANLKTEKNRAGANSLLLIMPFLTDIKQVKYFEKNGLSIRDKDNKGNNAFTYASKTGNISIMKELISLGIDPSANNDAAVIFAGKGTRKKKNSAETFEFLKQLGLSLNTIDEDGKNVLHYLSAYSKDDKLFNFLIENQVKLDMQDSKGNTPLCYALEYNNIDMIKLIIERDPELNTINKDGEGIIHLAVKSQEIEIVELILPLISDIDLKSANGLTPLQIAAATAKNDLILKLLVHSGANKNIKTAFDETAYNLALENQQLKDNGISVEFLK